MTAKRIYQFLIAMTVGRVISLTSSGQAWRRSTSAGPRHARASAR